MNDWTLFFGRNSFLWGQQTFTNPKIWLFFLPSVTNFTCLVFSRRLSTHQVSPFRKGVFRKLVMSSFCKPHFPSISPSAILISSLICDASWEKAKHTASPVRHFRILSDREGHGHKAVLYKSHFPPLRHSFSQRHHCIHRLINHVYTKGQARSYSLPHDRYLERFLLLIRILDFSLISTMAITSAESLKSIDPNISKLHSILIWML